MNRFCWNYPLACAVMIGGLKRDNLNFKTGVLKIERPVSRVRGTLIVSQSKTKTSNRSAAPGSNRPQGLSAVRSFSVDAPLSGKRGLLTRSTNSPTSITLLLSAKLLSLPNVKVLREHQSPLFFQPNLAMPTSGNSLPYSEHKP